MQVYEGVYAPTDVEEKSETTRDVVVMSDDENRAHSKPPVAGRTRGGTHWLQHISKRLLISQHTSCTFNLCLNRNTLLSCEKGRTETQQNLLEVVH